MFVLPDRASSNCRRARIPPVLHAVAVLTADGLATCRPVWLRRRQLERGGSIARSRQFRNENEAPRIYLGLVCLVLRANCNFRRLLSEVCPKERCDLSECFLAFRQGVVELVLGVRLALINLKSGFDPRPPQLAMHTNRVAQQTGHECQWSIWWAETHACRRRRVRSADP